MTLPSASTTKWTSLQSKRRFFREEDKLDSANLHNEGGKTEDDSLNMYTLWIRNCRVLTQHFKVGNITE